MSTEYSAHRRSDRALLDAWRGGDEEAGRELFSRHYRSVRRFFQNKAPADHEDLTQGTFLACLRHRDTIRDGARFLPYLLTIARNELYDHIERVSRRPIDPLTSSAVALSTGPVTAVGREQSQNRLHEALRELPIELQTVIELHYWEELTTAELGQIIDAPQGTVKTRLRRARQLLSTALDVNDTALDERLRRQAE